MLIRIVRSGEVGTCIEHIVGHVFDAKIPEDIDDVDYDGELYITLTTEEYCLIFGHEPHDEEKGICIYKNEYEVYKEQVKIEVD